HFFFFCSHFSSHFACLSSHFGFFTCSFFSISPFPCPPLPGPESACDVVPTDAPDVPSRAVFPHPVAKKPTIATLKMVCVHVRVFIVGLLLLDARGVGAALIATRAPGDLGRCTSACSAVLGFRATSCGAAFHRERTRAQRAATERFPAAI